MSNSFSESEFSLQPDIMFELYRRGAFPMAESKNSKVVEWYLPRDKRCIIPLDNYNIPRSLIKLMKRDDFEVRYDYDFPAVVRACAEREETWISERLIEAYFDLAEMNCIHTVEVYKADILVGGLYGVVSGGAFFGESMFSRVPQSSKIAFASLIMHLEERKFLLLDVQYSTEHLKMFGAVEIRFADYFTLLANALQKQLFF